MLVVAPGEGLEDRLISDLPQFLKPGDVLVLNDTRVIPAQLEGMRRREGAPSAAVGATLHQRTAPDRWRAFVRGAKKLRVGDRISFGHDANACLLGALEATVAEKGDEGEVELAFDLSGPVLDEAIRAAGHVPLPPYIAARRPDDERDRNDYQTMYAEHDGAVAAPTAGLHFTPELFAALRDKGVATHFVTLHVGAGTFLPVKADDTADHRMHAERGLVSAGNRRSAERGARVRRPYRRASARPRCACSKVRPTKPVEFAPFDGETRIFITPGYRFRACDLLMTNFHLPRSTLFMLVSAFSGLATMRAAYAHAIAAGYRFYSYGDACLLYPAR